MAEASRSTSVPRPPIATPICAALSDGASLTPAPVIATISPFALHDACENVGVSDDLSQFSVAHLLERFASHHAPHVEPGTPGDSGGGIPVVAGDHDNSNACRSAFLHRVGHARTQRIGQTDEPKKFEGKLARRSRVFAAAEGPHALRQGSEAPRRPCRRPNS